MTAFDVASRFIGLHEVPGPKHHPFIQWCLSLCDLDLDSADEVAWCSGFAQVPSFVLDMPRSKSAAARSWLKVGTPVHLDDARRGNDVVVLKRGSQPWQGHVGFYAGRSADRVLVLGGNQSDSVSIQPFPLSDVIAIRRLA